MRFAGRYIHALNALNHKDDDRHHQAEPLTAAALASIAGDPGMLLHRIKYAGRLTQTLTQAAAMSAQIEKS